LVLIVVKTATPTIVVWLVAPVVAAAVVVIVVVIVPVKHILFIPFSSSFWLYII